MDSRMKRNSFRWGNYKLPTGGSKHQIIYEGWRGWHDAGTQEGILGKRQSVVVSVLQVSFGSCWWLTKPLYVRLGNANAAGAFLLTLNSNDWAHVRQHLGWLEKGFFTQQQWKKKKNQNTDIRMYSCTQIWLRKHSSEYKLADSCTRTKMCTFTDRF